MPLHYLHISILCRSRTYENVNDTWLISINLFHFFLKFLKILQHETGSQMIMNAFAIIWTVKTNGEINKMMTGIYFNMRIKANYFPIMNTKMAGCYYDNGRCISLLTILPLKLVMTVLHQQGSTNIHMYHDCREKR